MWETKDIIGLILTLGGAVLSLVSIFYGLLNKNTRSDYQDEFIFTLSYICVFVALLCIYFILLEKQVDFLFKGHFLPKLFETIGVHNQLYHIRNIIIIIAITSVIGSGIGGLLILFIMYLDG